MQVSIKWLKDYIDFDLTAEELADKFTMAGVPVENVIRADEGLDKVVTGRIEKLAPHPDSDHLQICQMNVGEGTHSDYHGRTECRRRTDCPGCYGRCTSAQRPENQEGQAARPAVQRYALLRRKSSIWTSPS